MNAIQVLAGDAKQIPPDYNSAVRKCGETASQDASSHHHDCRNDADENVVMKLSSAFFHSIPVFNGFDWFCLRPSHSSILGIRTGWTTFLV